MLLFARLLVIDGEVVQAAAAQVAAVEMARGMMAAFAVCGIMRGMGMEVAVTGMDIEPGERGEGGERIGQHGACMGAEPGVDLGAQIQPPLAGPRPPNHGSQQRQPMSCGSL